MRAAVHDGHTVINVIVVADPDLFEVGDGLTLEPLDDAAVVGPGWTRGADGWHPPDHDEQQPPPPTDAERIARLEADNAALQDAVEKLILDQLLGGMP